MTLSALDPRTALIVVDLQKGIVAVPAAHPAETVVGNAARLAAAFRHRGLPVALVTVDGVPPGRTEQQRPALSFPPGWADLIPELDRQPQDIAVTKKTPGAFTKTELEARLRAEGVTQVVLAGISTSVGVEMTARQAFELGFNVTFATDAMTDRLAEAHDWSLARVFPRIGETGTTAEILALVGEAS